MEMRIKIPERIYDSITKENQISFDDLHELFDSIRNGIAADEADNRKVDEKPFEFILNKQEADVFNSLTNEQKEVVCKLLDNAAEQAEEKDVSKKIDNHVEVCHLMTVYLGRNFDPHEARIIALYKTIADNKETLAGLSGMDKVLAKSVIRSLVL